MGYETWNPFWDDLAAIHPPFRQQWKQDPESWGPVLDIQAQSLAQTRKEQAAYDAMPVPSLMDKAKSLGKSLYQLGRSLIAGNPIFAQEETFNSRLVVCQGCEHWDDKHLRCLVCGCYQTKLWLKYEQCPLPNPKWGPEP